MQVCVIRAHYSEHEAVVHDSKKRNEAVVLILQITHHEVRDVSE